MSRPVWASRRTACTSESTPVAPDNSEQQTKDMVEAKIEILRLRSQLRRAEEERDLLKETSREFPKEPE